MFSARRGTCIGSSAWLLKVHFVIECVHTFFITSEFRNGLVQPLSKPLVSVNLSLLTISLRLRGRIRLIIGLRIF